MYIKALLLVTALGATALPASAQAYGNNNYNCRERAENRAGGAVLGAIVGGVLGSNVAGRGHRGDGTALGAVLGGVVGSEVGRSSTPCAPYGAQGNYPVNSYPATQYPGGAYPPAPPGTYSPYQGGSYPPPPPADYGYYPEGQYGDDSRYEPEYDRDGKHRDGVYGRGNRSYNRNGDYAGRDCDTATQITRLPDGSEIRRPVEACRNSYYGDWHVRD